MINILTWSEAKKHKEKMYASAKYCKHCGGNARYTCSGSCVYCICKKSQEITKAGYHRDRYKENPERTKNNAKKWAEANKETVYSNIKRWQAENAEKVRQIKIAYKAKRRTQEKKGDATKVICQWVENVDKVCHWCGVKCESGYHIDHYQPLSKGGSHSVLNMVIACKSCNLHKSNKDPYAFANSLGRLF